MSSARRVAVYTDEDVDGRVARQLQRLDYDVISSHAAGNSGQRYSDEWQLEYAVQHQRVILTHNIADFHRLARDWHMLGKEHYGILLSPQLEVGALIRRTALHLDRITPDEHHNLLMYLG